MILNILIPTIPERQLVFRELMNNIYLFIRTYGLQNKVEVLYDDTKKGLMTTGEKRNRLLSRAIGKYIWMIDDDDEIYSYSLNEIVNAAETNCDVMGINGIMTTDGCNMKKWYIALGNPYIADYSTGQEVYLRYPNHITPLKRELVKDFKFPDQSSFEDKAWADKILEAGVLKSQTVIEPPMYHYRYSTINKSYA